MSEDKKREIQDHIVGSHQPSALQMSVFMSVRSKLMDSLRVWNSAFDDPMIAFLSDESDTSRRCMAVLIPDGQPELRQKIEAVMNDFIVSITDDGEENKINTEGN